MNLLRTPFNKLSHRQKLLAVLLVIAVILSLIGAGLATLAIIYRPRNIPAPATTLPFKVPPTVEVSSSPLISAPIKPTIDIDSSNKIFYFDIASSPNILSYDTETREVASWIDDTMQSKFLSGSNVAASNLKVVDNYFLSFITNEGATGKIFLLDLRTKNLVLVKNLESIDQLLSASFYSGTKFAYSYVDSNSTHHLVLNDGNQRVLKSTKMSNEITDIDAKTSDDSVFSPSGRKLLYSSTFTRSRSTTEMYDFVSLKETLFEDYIQAIWLSEDEFVAVRDETEGWTFQNGIYRFGQDDLYPSDKLSGIPTTAINPQPSPDKKQMLYGDYQSPTIGIYDFASQSSTTILKDAGMPLWVSDQQIFFHRTENCHPLELEKCLPRSYLFRSPTKLDLKTGEYTVINHSLIQSTTLLKGATKFNFGW